MEEKTEKMLVHKKENRYFWFVLSISLAVYTSLIVSVVGILVIAGFALVSFIISAITMGRIRTNAVKLSPNQFPDIFQKTVEVCEKMNITQIPDIYIMQSGGVLNAFATRFFKRNMVVLYSDIFDLINAEAEEEVYFVLAHELAHIKRNHVSKLMFILPAMWIPGIAELYLRACEYTCDRYAAYYTDNQQAAENGLTMLGIGKNLYKQVNVTEYIQQLEKEKGLVVWLSELLSTHPPLPKRIQELDNFFETNKYHIDVRQTSRRKWLLVPALLAAVAVVAAGGFFTVNKVSELPILPGLLQNVQAIEETPPLIDAVLAGNTAEAEALIADGADLEEKDYDGSTALHWAVEDENEEMVRTLTEAGADADAKDDYDITPLMIAAEYGNEKIIGSIVEAGADVNAKDIDEMTPLIYAVYSDSPEIVQLLIDMGADPAIKDITGMTPLMVAVEWGNREIVDTLKKAAAE